MKTISTFLFISFFIFYLFLKLGVFLDITTNPRKVDLLVNLGGGDYKSRIRKTIEIYKKGYIATNTIIFSGKVEFKEVDKDNILIVKRNLINTYEEISFVIDYMKKNKLKSATFVSEAPHSKRIILLTNLIKNDNLEFNVVASDFKEWDSLEYYKNSISIKYAFVELIKIINNLFIYIIIDKLGLKDSYQKYFKKMTLFLNKQISYKKD